MPEYLFVYGTLMDGLEASALLSGSARFVCRASMPGRLYDLGAYPAAVAGEGPADVVIGEVYELTDEEAICAIDDYEGCRVSEPGSLFTRATVTVQPAAREALPLSAWAYLFARNLPPQARRIHSGDYRHARAPA